jgi:hypothetical protein
MQTQQNKNTDPIDKKEEVQKSKDKHIDQDFEGYPHHPAKEKIIHPQTEEELNIAGSGDEEEFAHVKPDKEDANEQNIVHTGSGGAFEATEEVDHNDELTPEEKKGRDNIY